MDLVDGESLAMRLERDGPLEPAEAARIVGTHPLGMQLRYLQTLTEIATEKNSTVIFPLPIDLIEPLLSRFGGKGSESKDK